MRSLYYRSLPLAEQSCDIDIEPILHKKGISFPEWLKDNHNQEKLPPYLSELARLEQIIDQVAQDKSKVTYPVKGLIVNPTLQLVEMTWTNLIPVLTENKNSKDKSFPVPGKELILIWRRVGGRVHFKVATKTDFLALKLVSEDLDLQATATENNITIGVLDEALRIADNKEILLSPETLLVRNPEIFKATDHIDSSRLSAYNFTLQWHITQVCDLHCKHCYDRSSRKAVSFDEGKRILDDFRSFCRERNVNGHVTFTGGNPLMYPDFKGLYKEAADRGFELAILGNPASRAEIEEIQAIKPMKFFQVSLEGLEEHNNEIRGAGHFQRIFDFLTILKHLDIYSMVMLTLTRANQQQVLPLAELLRDKVDLFNFNRLAMVGEGSQLLSAPTENYQDFLLEYQLAAKSNPCMGFKDNHFNSCRSIEGKKLFGGCTGYGCGAAFNFVSLLPEGELHACRKSPSYIGSMLEQSLSDIYDSELAEKYRNGSEACKDCKTRPVCGGCLAVAHGLGLDIFKDKDPYCFLS